MFLPKFAPYFSKGTANTSGVVSTTANADSSAGGVSTYVRSLGGNYTIVFYICIFIIYIEREERKREKREREETRRR